LLSLHGAEDPILDSGKSIRMKKHACGMITQVGLLLYKGPIRNISPC